MATGVERHGAAGEPPVGRAPSSLELARTGMVARGLLLAQEHRSLLAAQPGLLWRRRLGVQNWAMEAAAGHGSLFVLGSPRPYDTDLCAFDLASGELQWSAPGARNDPSAGLALTSDGVVFVHEQDAGGRSVLEVYTASGTRLAQTTVPGRGRGSPPVMADGAAVLAIDDGSGGALIAVDVAAGDPRWHQRLPFRPAWGAGPVIVDHEGEALVLVAGDPVRAGDDGGVMCLALADGSERWRRRGGAWDNLRVVGSTVVAIEWDIQPTDWRDGGNWQRPAAPRRTTLWGIDPTGAILWRHDDARWVYAAANMLVATRWGRPCLGIEPPTGTVAWDLPNVAKLVGVTETLVLGSSYAEELVAWNAATGARRWRLRLPEGLDGLDLLAIDAGSSVVLANRRELAAIGIPSLHADGGER